MTGNKLKINLPSRYSEISTVLIQTEDPNVFHLNTNSNYIRYIFDAEKDVEDRKIKHIDFEGGPLISIGDTDLYEGHILKDVYYSLDDNCYKFIFDENKE